MWKNELLIQFNVFFKNFQFSNVFENLISFCFYVSRFSPNATFTIWFRTIFFVNGKQNDPDCLFLSKTKQF